jgi:hypothetical protein
VSSLDPHPKITFDRNAPILKIAVMATGVITADGLPTSLESLRVSISSIAQRKGMVWYYREAAQTAAPPQSAEIVKLIIEHRVPVRFSTRPDYSDSVGRDGKPIGRDGQPIQPHSSQTLIERTQDAFGSVRAQASQGNLVVVRNDGKTLLLPALRVEKVKAEAVAAVEGIIPSTTKRNVAAIADTSWANTEAPAIQAAGRAIPFFGLLMGFASIGHSVWLFDATANLLVPGCRQADVLIVDSACLGSFAPEWQRDAAKVMRDSQIFVHDRMTHTLRRTLIHHSA